MIVEPELRVADFAKAGADIISVHCEGASTIHLHRTVNMIKDLGCASGVVLNPGTPLSQIEYVLDGACTRRLTCTRSWVRCVESYPKMYTVFGCSEILNSGHSSTVWQVGN